MTVSIDLVLFFTRGHSVEVLSKEPERLKVVLGQLMKQLLELEHPTLAVLEPIHANHTLIQLCTHTQLTRKNKQINKTQIYTYYITHTINKKSELMLMRRATASV